MMNNTPITITQSDFLTLKRLLEDSSNRELPGIDMLRDEVSRAHIVPRDEISPDCVTMNSIVQFVDDETDKTYQLTLVYPDQAQIPGTVSILAPVGCALLGLRVGQIIRWQVPGGHQLQLRVVSIVSQPESAAQTQATS